MHYKILKSFKGSPNGTTVNQYAEGDTCTHDELGDSLAQAALDEKWIAKAKVKQAKAETETEGDSGADA